MRFQVLPGFRDFFPEDLAFRRWIESAWHGASRAAGFQEFDGPVLEALELFTAKSGEEISGQLYTFVDKGDRAVALRPEMTPTLARMMAARASQLPRPIKWYCVPEFYRYEKPQRGRLRAFQQWNVDVLGSTEPAADAEPIAVALDALRRLGIGERDVRVLINDRRLLARTLRELDVLPAQDAEVLAIVDKLDRDRGARERLEKLLGAARAKALLGYCDAFPLERAPELAAVLDACREYGIGDALVPDFKIVRGLAYYTGPVWEIFDAARELRAVAGGGRYDNLIGALGGPELPALGFGMGDAVLGELLAAKGLAPATLPRVDVVVVPVVAELLGPARRLVARLRANGTAAEAPYGATRVGKALKAADAAGAARVVIVGPDEWANGEVVVKDLASGVETRVRADDLS
ncbi:MAG: histidine--tRNA ligase [Myxococcota bacterium]